MWAPGTAAGPKGQKVHHDIHQLLGEGKIIAIKGLGAFHLAVDATNAQAVAELRRRKKRDAKPFAVMVKDLATAYEYCFLDKQEEDWLQSPAAPIVVLHSKFNKQLAGSEIHPGLNTLGLMLPYTPLHTLLFNDQIKSLVMTSANISDEPLITDNQEAMQELKDVADYFLVHDREIVNPCDDSVMAVFPQGSPHYIRRARGFVPRGIPIPISTAPVLAVGGFEKHLLPYPERSLFKPALGRYDPVWKYQRFQVGLERFKRMLDVEPAIRFGHASRLPGKQMGTAADPMQAGRNSASPCPPGCSHGR